MRQLKWGTPDVVVLWQQSDAQVCGYAQAIFGNEYYRGTSTNSFGRQRSTMQIVGLLPCLTSWMMEPSDDCGAPMSNDCQPCGHAQAHVRLSISLEHLHKDKDGGRKWERDVVDLLVTRRPNQSRGAESGRQNVRLQ
jgi:hypothetical protein